MQSMSLITVRGAVITLVGAIFALDLATPTGFPVWVFFVIPLLVVVPLRSETAIWWTAGVILTLTIAGAVFSPTGIAIDLALLHRSMGVLSLGSIAAFQIFSLRARRERDRSEEQLHLALQHKDVLMRELQHRVKNSLGLVASMLRLEGTSQDHPDLSRSIERSTHRIMAVAKAYGLLDKAPGKRSVSLDWYLRDILESLGQAYLAGDGRVRLSHSIEDIEIDTRRAVALGLIVNELVMNAIKHAFPGDTEGSIMVSARRDMDTLHVAVRDSGTGNAVHPRGNTGGSLGMELVDLLTEEINGQKTKTYTDGYSVCITVPLDHGVDAPAHGPHADRSP